MAELVSLMCTQRSARQSFTVNKLVREVNIDFTTERNIVCGAVPDLTTTAGVGRYIFQAGESLRILSVGVNLPFGFQRGDQGFFIQFSAYTIAGTIINTDLSGSDFYIPYENAEINFDTFLRNPAGTLPFALVARIRNAYQDSDPKEVWSVGKVSMLNVPASIADGEIFYTQVFVKVMHNLPLVLTV